MACSSRACGTTGIYCRPICPARRPARGSCEFFPTASGAEQAGYRPCLRCRPEAAPGHSGRSLAEALLQRIQERAVEGARLSALDAELGMSARQVRRLLTEHFGVSPVEVARTQRLLLAKQLLQETGMPLGEIALAAGFRSVRNFNASFQQHYALTPRQCREAQPLRPESGLRLKLSYRAPLAWGALLDYFRSRLVPGVEAIDGQEYRRTVQLDGVVGWLRVWPAADKPELLAELSPALWSQVGAVRTRLRRMFDLDANPAAVAEVLGNDPLTGPVLEAYPGLRIGGAWESFELAVRAVLGQQVTVAAATTLSGRLAARLGAAAETPFADLNRLAITPQALATMTVDDLCRLGLVSARARTLLELSRFALAGGLEFPPGTTDEAVVQSLVALPGIGPWTAHYIAMRALRYPDAFPAADLGLRKAIGKGTLVTTHHAEQRSEAWRPWRAYAAAALWKSLP